MERLRWQPVAMVFVVATVLSTMVLRVWVSRGNNPVPVPLVQVVLVVVLAVGVLALGLRIRRLVRKGEPVEPAEAVRTLVLGQAAVITGAAHLGYFVAQLLLALPRLEAPEPRAQAWMAASAITASLLMIAAGWLTEWCCRVPPSDDDADDEEFGDPGESYLFSVPFPTQWAHEQ